MIERESETSPALQSKQMQPLEGRTVVVTRAATQAAEFVAELESYGARVQLCPAIEIVEPESYEPLDRALENLFGYDWLIFTSANGVEYFLRRMEARGMEASELDELRVCAIGTATADRLHDERIHVDVIPTEFKAEGVFRALELYAGGRENLRLLNFLIPRAAVARDYLPHALEEAGARADVVPAYRTVRPASTDRARLEALLVGGSVDCITFTSSSTISNFAQLFDTTDLSSILNGVTVASIGDITTRTAAEYGLRAAIQPTEFTTRALARAIADHYAKLNVS